jgi:hypothetical protein
MPLPEVQPETVPEPIFEGIGEIIEEAASGLLNGIWEFVQWIFGPSFKIILDGVKSAPGALLLPIQNILNIN